MAEKRLKMNGESLREQVFRYVRTKYSSEIEYPWAKHPNDAVFRHADNRKWYGLVIRLPAKRLGLAGDGSVDILNVKLDEPFLRDEMIRQDGYFTGYHMGRGTWMSLLLDGTVPFSEVCGWIDVSYRVTASGAKKKKLRPPKEWLIPANPKYYDVVHAFDHTDTINWKQGSGVRTGDTVFLYVGAPVSAILYRCRVMETDIPYDYQDGKLSIQAVMKIKLQKRFPPDSFPMRILRDEYRIYAVRGPRGVPHSLRGALAEQTGEKERAHALTGNDGSGEG